MVKNSTRKHSIPAWLVLIALCLVVSPFPSNAQTGRAKVSGTIVDDEGKPIGKIKVVLKPMEGSTGTDLVIKVNAKGKFKHSFVPTGRYSLDTTDESLYIRHYEVQITDDSGIELNRFESDAHPDHGLPPFGVSAGLKANIIAIATDASYREKVRQALMLNESSSELQGLIDLYSAGNMEGLVIEADRVLGQNPGLAFGHFLRGMALSRLSRPEEAEASLRQAIALDAQLPDAKGALGSLLVKRAGAASEAGDDAKGKALYGEAADLLQKEIASSPKPATALLVNHALALEKSGKTPEAIAALEKVIEVDPSHVSTYYRLADLYRDFEKDEDKALAILERVPSGEGGEGTGEVIFNMAVKHYNAGNYDEALEILTQALETYPDHPLLHRLLGRTYLATNEFELAASELQKFVDLAPDHPKAEEARQILESLTGGGS